MYWLKSAVSEFRMIRITSVCLIFCLTACAGLPITPAYKPKTPASAVEAWSDAYNGDRMDQMELLVHPLRRGHFDSERAHLRTRLSSWRIDKYLLGAAVRVNDEYPGHEVTLYMHDGRRAQEKTVVIVQAKELWWLWNY